MDNKINMINGMPVEISELDAQGEQERKRFNEMALQEYDDSGTLSSEKLLEANENFLQKAKKHLLDDHTDAKYEK